MMQSLLVSSYLSKPRRSCDLYGPMVDKIARALLQHGSLTGAQIPELVAMPRWRTGFVEI